MTTATLTKRDLALRDAVVRQLEWDPEVDVTGIGVTATAGAVTLAGFSDTYAGKLAAERAAKRVIGVRAVANELQVRLRTAHADDDIARHAATTLAAWTEAHPGVQVSVHNGHLTLTGTVRWIFQREWAEAALRHVPGVVSVINRITVRPDGGGEDVRPGIIDALRRTADVTARDITVTVDGSSVTLGGTVPSWAHRDAAERTAAAAPGVTHVNNLIEVAAPNEGDALDEQC